MKTRSKKYWARRNEALEKSLQKNAEVVRDDIIRQYENAIEEINADIHATFKAYVSNGIPDGEAEKLLNAAEHDKTYQELLKLYDETDNVKVKEDILAHINAQAYGARMSRLEGVKARIYTQLRKVGNYSEKKLKPLYTNTLQESYYTNIYNIAEGLDCGIDFTVLPQRAIDKMLREPWKGSNYSERVWKHNDRFIEAVQDSVSKGIIAGHSNQRIAASLTEYTKSESADGIRYSTERLARTETSHFINQGQLAAYKEIGMDKYQILAALSERTCATCAALDGKTFYVNKAAEGKNFPPIHPNCRCITILAGTMPDTRIACDPETGKTYKVDGSMTFKEWKESLTPEQEQAFNLHVKQMKNKSADKALFEKYSQIYGSEFSKTLEEFQEMKYTDISRWKEFMSGKQERLNQMEFENMGGLVGKLGNKEVRLWYKTKDAAITGNLDISQPLEQQAREAHKMRNLNRTNARELMKDVKLRDELNQSDPNRPFEYYFEKYKKQGLSDKDVYREIIYKSTTTNEEADRKAGVEI